MHRTKDKDSAGGSTPSCSLAAGTVFGCFRLTAAARSSINAGELVHLVRSGGLKASLGGRKPVLPFAHISILLQLLIQLFRWSSDISARVGVPN